MAGMGPPPKNANQRVRRNKDSVPHTTLRFEKVDPPPLPSRYAGNEEVERWWQTWVESPQADVFGTTDWQGLLDTLPLIAAYYDGNLKLAAEIRLRVAAYGSTPADRARLRMHFADADEKDSKRGKPTGKPTEEVKQTYGDLRVVGND